MRRLLKHILCVVATLLAFYVGYAWQGKTQASLCVGGAKCGVGVCSANVVSPPGCTFTSNNTGNICLATPNDLSNTCQVPDTQNRLACTGIDGNGNQCTGYTFICAGPCPP